VRFDEFAKEHGLIIDHIVPFRWVATPTTDHPRKKNGRYKFMGDHGFVQNWATMQQVAVWKADKGFQISPQMHRQRIEFEAQRKKDADRAAVKAQKILDECINAPHPYLTRKGFPDEATKVWVIHDEKRPDPIRLLVIPMRRDGNLVGVQLIDEEGGKKFLYGQITKGATFDMKAKGVTILCEGYATALSVKAAMTSIKLPYTIRVCFSASNMEEVARSIPDGIIVADNDTNGVGERAARNTGKKYWISPAIGEDFNDYHLRNGLFQAALSLKKILLHKTPGKA
jgi:putative DNA primase/helicase